MDDAFGYWLSGLIDGEGCFQISSYKNSAGSARCRLRFTLALRDDDAGVLDEIVEQTGIGELVLTSRNNERWGDVAVWRIVRRREQFRLCEILDRFPLRAKKRADYEVWREAALTSGKIYRGGDLRRIAANAVIWDRLFELRELLHAVRSYPFATPLEGEIACT